MIMIMVMTIRLLIKLSVVMIVLARLSNDGKCKHQFILCM